MARDLIQMQLPPLALYIHIPWCEKKCPYCDFNSIVAKNRREDEYVQSLILDLEQDLPKVQNRKISSVFIGGGTPSLISAQGLNDIFNALHKKLNFAENCEISMEANPGTTNKQKLRDFRASGINRLSFGVQSFQNTFLQSLGRIHNAEQAKQAFYQAREVGFDNINLDLIFGLPAQKMENALYDLQTALDLQPEHLSWYQLTIEPNTAFYKKPPVLPQEDYIFEIYQEGRKFLQENSYLQYEVSAYSKPNKECRHNINYWQFGDYLGIGAGAAGKLSQFAPLNAKPNFTYSANLSTNAKPNFADSENLALNAKANFANSPNLDINAKSNFENLQIWRTSKVANLNKYIDRRASLNFYSECLQTERENILFEFMLNALRLKRGFSLEIFEQRTGLNAEFLLKRIQPFIKKGWLTQEANRICTTEEGFLWINEILLDFLD